MSSLVDCRGLACPEPVLRTRRALAAAGGATVTVLVSDEASRDNVCRAGRQLGRSVSVRQESRGFAIMLAAHPAPETGTPGPGQDA